MEGKLLEWIAWFIVAGKVLVQSIIISMMFQFVVYQGSKKRINPFKIIENAIFKILCFVARVEV